MSEYKFIRGFPIEGLKENFESTIFHQTRHLLLQSQQGWYSYAIVKYPDNIIEAIIHFHIHESIAISPLRASFGSLLFSEVLSADVVKQFLGFVHEDLLKEGILKVIIKSYPEAYFSRGYLLQSLLLQQGYSMDQVDQSAVISISDKPFIDGLHKSPRAQLKKCHRSVIRAVQIPIANLSDVYFFLKMCHEKKGYSLSMSFQKLEKTVNAFPDNFFLFAVFSGEEMIAANISIRINTNILYHFYQNHVKSADNLSPLIFLSEFIYQFCQQEGIKMLDLGTSSVDRVINQSLLDFKLRLGAVPSPKVTFVKSLNP